MFKKAILIVLVLLMIPAMVLSQGITTASLNGTVTTQSGEPLFGANVVAVHEPSGSTFGAASRSNGRFNIPGVRVGGPYTVTVSYIGYQTEKQEDIFLSLGADIKIGFVMLEQAIELPTVIVTVAERNAILTASNVGTATNVTTAQIERLPTMQRTIDDFTRLTPQVNGQSVAGKNSKFNNFQVDGAVLNDAFGLSTRPGEGAGQQPISLDAIQEFNVEIAPYDVRSGGFAGGLINAITRSGDNQFRGSGYFFGRNQDFINNEVVGVEQPLDDFDEVQAGFRFSGPIVQNKAFFFVNADITRRDDPNFAAINDPTAPINFPVPESDILGIIDISKNQYGYDPGGFDPFTEETDGIKLFARADINLSTRHRLTLRHSLVDGQRDSGLSRNSRSFTLESGQFVRESTTNQTVAQLNSTFGNNIANEARLAFTGIRQRTSSPFGAFPHVVVDVGPGRVRLGPDGFSQDTALSQDIFEVTNNLMAFTGDHTITVGTHNEFIHFNNFFIQDFFGSYVFDSIDDFAAGRPSQYRLSVSKTDNPRQSAKWDLIQLGFYAQDECKPTPKLNLTVGLRADILIVPDDPLRNDLFASQFPGFHTDQVPNGKTSWSPRFGFNYDLTGNRTTQIRGGGGIFAGTPPAVWLSNQYSNTGVNLFRIFVTGDATPDFSADPNNQPVIGDPSEPQTTAIELTDPDFKMPQVFRSNVAIDRQMPFGLVGTLEFLYSKNINEVLFRNILIGDFGAPLGSTPDGRPDYGGQRVSSDFTRVIVLENTSKGYQWMLTAQIQTPPNQGPLKNLLGGLSYTLMDGRDVNSGRSAAALSAWRFNETDDP
ncbi:MAG: TonB-dependent receptor domain-containing protein, partial [bacterium]